MYYAKEIIEELWWLYELGGLPECIVPIKLIHAAHEMGLISEDR